MLDRRYYVGPLGALRALPDVEADTDVPLTLIGGTHTSLTGAFTRDVFGWKRSWTWQYDVLTLHQQQWVEALQTGLVPGPLYLVDPRRPNRLPEQVASGGSRLRSPDGFVLSNTSVGYWRPLSYVSAADQDTLPAAPLLRGCLEWQLIAPGAARMELAGDAADGRLNTPVRPGEPIEVSGWFTGLSSASVALTAAVFDTKGTVLATASSTVTRLSGTAWERRTAALTCPDGAAYVRLRADTGTGTPTGSLYVTALQVARSDDPERVPEIVQPHRDDPDPSGGWRLGGGAPAVVADAGPTSYVRPGLYSTELTFTERD